jgi:hypothetical protein
VTLFRPAVIEAQRRRVYGSVTVHQPTRLAAFTAVAVISVLIGTAYLALGQFANSSILGFRLQHHGQLVGVEQVG